MPCSVVSNDSHLHNENVNALPYPHICEIWRLDVYAFLARRASCGHPVASMVVAMAHSGGVVVRSIFCLRARAGVNASCYQCYQCYQSYQVLPADALYEKWWPPMKIWRPLFRKSECQVFVPGLGIFLFSPSSAVIGSTGSTGSTKNLSRARIMRARHKKLPLVVLEQGSIPCLRHVSIMNY